MKRFTTFALLLLFCCLHLRTMDGIAQTISKTESTDEVELKMRNISLYVNRQTVAETGGGMGGKVLWFTLKDGRQFIVSTNPHNGYDFKKAGKIVGNVISFWHEDNYYEWTSTELITSDGLEKEVWLLVGTSYLKNNEVKGITFGAASPFYAAMKDR
jgi:hypothetical protein